MIAELEKTKPERQNTGEKMRSSQIASIFEDILNEDLDVKSAFDHLYQIISELHEM